LGRGPRGDEHRPDCLGHIGIAREVSVLWNKTLTIPAANPKEGKTPVDQLVKVRIECPTFACDIRPGSFAA